MSDTSPVSLVCCDVVGAAAVEGNVLERAFIEAIGRRAGARFVIGVLSGVHDGRRLRRSGATHLLADLGELPDLLASPL